MQSAGAQRRLAAVLAADVVGYSRLMQQDDQATLAALTERRGLFAARVAAGGGRIVNAPGDSILAEFPSVVAAVECAIELQGALAALDAGLEEAQRMRFRMGIHLGDVLVDGAGIYGDGVNIAARLESAADPGGVALSAAAYEQVRDKLPLRFADRGEHAVKNIGRPVRIYALEGADAVPGRTPARRLKPAWLLAGLALVLLALGAWLAATLLHEEPIAEAAAATIAVLPFANQSGDPKREYFSDGVTEDVIAALGRFSGVRVMSYNAVQPYKAAPAAGEQIGSELGVRYLVRGSVRHGEGRVRVGVELSEAAGGRLLWSERYDAEGREVLEMQDRIARSVAGALAVTLTRFEHERVAAKRTENLEAYDLVLRARELVSRYERAPNREARMLLARALELEPRYAEAWAWLAQAELQRAIYGWTEAPEAAVRRAEQHALAALAIDEGDARAHAVLGGLYSFVGNYHASLAESERALALNPSDAVSYTLRAGVLLWLGRIEESIRASETAQRYEPRQNSNGVFTLALAYHLAGRHRDAVAALESYRGESVAELQAVLAAAYAELGEAERSRAAAAEARRLNPFFDVGTFGERFADLALAERARAGMRKAGL